MKNKIITSLMMFTATFVLSTLVFLPLALKVKASVFTTKTDIHIQNKISKFLQKDLENRQIKVKKLVNNSNDMTPVIWVSAINEYAYKTETMNLSGFPEDFQIAWLRYARATRESANLISNLKSLPKKTILDQKEAEMAKIKFDRERETWGNVLLIAAEYGVNKYK